LASKEDEALHKDETAAQLLNQYASQFSLDQGFNSPLTCEVYSFEMFSPEQLPGVKRHEKDKKKEARRKGDTMRWAQRNNIFDASCMGSIIPIGAAPFSIVKYPFSTLFLARNISQQL
jgi:hypothetical protein